MREIRQSGSEGGARFNPLSLPLSGAVPGCARSRVGLSIFVVSVAKRGFNRSRQLTATELSVHNQCKEMKRREFLTTTMAASTLAGLGTASLTASAAERAATGHEDREYYELRAYRLKGGANSALLHNYIEKAAIPALNRLGVKPVGV